MTANSAVLNRRRLTEVQTDRQTEGQTRQSTYPSINQLAGQPNDKEIDRHLIYYTNIILFIPNRTFFVRFGEISGRFGAAKVRILMIRSRIKIRLERPNAPGVPSQHTKKVRLGISSSNFPSLFVEKEGGGGGVH